MEFEMTQQIDKQDEAAVCQGLLEYNLARLEEQELQDLGIFLRSEDGKITAGLTGHTHGNWLYVKYLWVSKELRGQGIGQKLVAVTEKTAKERGCKYAFLNTFSFQAPDFYKKLGYKEVFTLENYPVTGQRIYFIKEL